MAEDGTLQNIILDYVLLNNVIEVDNINELKEYDAQINKIIQTKNFNLNDGNGSLYKIVEDANLYVDNVNTILLNNGLKAIKMSNFYNYQKPFPIDYTKNDYSILIGFDMNAKAQSYLCHKYNEFVLLKEKAFDNIDNKIDVSLFYHEGKFFCFDDYGRDYPIDIPSGIWYGSNHISLVTSTDFNHWSNRFDLPIPSRFWQAFAPEIFKDTNGDIYCVFTGSTDYTIVDNQFVFKTYIMKALNDDLTAWSEPVLININDNNLKNQLDPFLIKRENIYHLFVKDEVTKKYRQYTSDTLYNFNFLQEVTSSDIAQGVEGGEIIYQNGIYYFYVEGLSDRRTHVAYSTDLINWSNFEKVLTFYDIPTRHFGFITVNTPELHAFFDNYIVQFPMFEEKAKVYELYNYNWYFRNKEIEENIDVLKLQKNMIYRVSGDNQFIINDFDLSEIDEGNFVGFLLGTDSLIANITIKANNHLLYNYGDYIIGKDYRNTLILFIKYGNWLIPLNNLLPILRYNTQYISGIVTSSNVEVSKDIPLKKAENIWNHDLYKLTIDIGDTGASVLVEYFIQIFVEGNEGQCNINLLKTNNLVGEITNISFEYNNDTELLNVKTTANASGKIRYTLEKITEWK